MADRSIPELEAVPIASLPVAPDIYDDGLMAYSHQGVTYKIRGAQWKGYAQAAVRQHTEAAQTAASEAKKALQDVEAAKDAAGKSAKDAAGSASAAKEYSGKPPIIRDGTWWTWDAEKKDYTDTGYPARGDVRIAAFDVDPATGELVMYIDEEYSGPEFRLRDGALEVVFNA